MDKSKKVYDIFQRISPFYDEANDRISLGLQKKWKEELVKLILENPKANLSLLDICCGTGDISIGLAKNSHAEIVGLDFSENMLKIAENKKGALTNLSFVRGDAKNLAFADESFDGVCISFGLRNTDDYKKVISEMLRVLKNNSYIYIMDSFLVENKLIKPFYKVFFKYLMPILGGGMRRYKDYSWLYESTKNFISPRELMDILDSFGVKNIRTKKMLFGACVIVKGQKL